MVIAGKIVNNYQTPLKEFNGTTGLACAVYLETDPIAQMGFDGRGKKAPTAGDLTISPETLNEIYAAGKPINLSLTLAGRKYRSTCSAIVDAKGEKIGVLMVAMPEQVITEIEQRVSQYGNTEKRNLQFWLLGFGIAALVALFVISMIIANQVSRPILSVVTLANAIAAGDLTQRLNMDRQDEIGHMAVALDNSCKNLSGMVARIKDNADMLASAAEEMSAVSAQMASNAEEMSAQSGTVAGATEEMSASINSMASAAEEMSVNIQSVSSTSEQMSQNMDAGKGFAVVANEIKELARQSAQAAEDIAKRIEGVQVNTKQAAKVIGEIAEVIQQVNDSSLVITKSVEQQTVTANEISGNVQQASSGVNNIAAAIAEIARGANDVSKSTAETAKGVTEISANTQGVSQAANDSNSGARQVSTSAGELAKMAVEIQTMVARFKIEKK